MRDQNFKLLVFDDLGKIELFSVPDIKIDEEIQQKLLGGLGKCKVTRPLLHEQSQEWFHPAGSIKLVQVDDQIFFSQDGVHVFEVEGQDIQLNVYAKGPTHQNPKFVFEYKPSGPAVHINFYEPARKMIRSITTTFGSWKTCFGEEHLNHLFWHRKMKDRAVKKIRIALTKKLPCLDTTPRTFNDNEFLYTEDECGNSITLPAESYMFISSENLFLSHKEDLEMDPDRLPYKLIRSSAYELSENGKECLKSLVQSVSDGFARWKAPGSLIVAPIAFFVQSSGAGKSRMSVELIQELPGFYCILKENSRSNTIFSELKSALTDYHGTLFKDVVHENGSIPAKSLKVFAKMITIYLRQWHAYIMDSVVDNPGEEDIEILARRAFARIGKLFYRNELIECSFLDDSELDLFVQAGMGANDQKTFNAAQAARFVKLILDEPSKAFPAVFDGDEVAFEAMKTVLAMSPFVIVLDEADFFSDVVTSSESRFPISTFENLRRCLSYLEPQTKLFFLAPCRNANKSFLYQPLSANYGKNKHKTQTLEPIVLKSNSLNDYPPEEVVINYKVASNPMFFKFLATLSAPVWGSVSFDRVVIMAAQMLKCPAPSNRPINPFERYDPDPDENCLLAIWMIRTGLIHLPADSEHAGFLVERHLATLLDTSPLRVTYPSDPILAMASRFIIDSLKRRELLFHSLRRMHDNLRLPSVDLTMIVGIMTCLMAIVDAQKSMREGRGLHPNDDLVDELCVIMPKLEPLWRKKKHVLQATVSSYEDHSISKQFHVVKVRDFLISLLKKKVFDKIESNLPTEILDGLMNASHSVKVTLEGESLKYHNLPFTAPRESKSINDAMLRLGLTMQCMFSMSGCDFGFDLLIPVVLEDDSFTYLAIKFGSIDSVDGDKILAVGNYDQVILSVDFESSEPFIKQEESRNSQIEAEESEQTVPVGETETDKSELPITEAICASDMVALVSLTWKNGRRQFCIATRGIDCFPCIYKSEYIVSDVTNILKSK